MKLLIEGLMKDYETKKELAGLFTLNYPTILKDHIADDQARDMVTRFCVCSFSVASKNTSFRSTRER